MKALLIFCLFLSLSLKAFSDGQECVVDSAEYSAFLEEGYQVPLKDNTPVTIDGDGLKLNSMTIGKPNIITNCRDELHVLDDKEMVKNLLKATGETNFDRFLGYKLGLCNTVDEGFFVLVGNNDGYLAYSGPYELPFSIVKLSCQ